MKERSTLVLSLALLGGLAAGSYWLAEQARLGDAAQRARRHEPDYFVDRFALTRMDENGRGRYSISADRVVHYPDDDSTEMTQPRLVSLAAERARVSMRAERGHISSDGVEVLLSGNVEIHRAPSGKDAETTLRSPSLLVLPEQDIARTSEPVEMLRGGSRMAARGLEFDNGKRLTQLNPQHLAGARVHATFEPKSHAATAAAKTTR